MFPCIPHSFLRCQDSGVEGWAAERRAAGSQIQVSHPGSRRLGRLPTVGGSIIAFIY